MLIGRGQEGPHCASAVWFWASAFNPRRTSSEITSSSVLPWSWASAFTACYTSSSTFKVVLTPLHVCDNSVNFEEIAAV